MTYGGIHSSLSRLPSLDFAEICIFFQKLRTNVYSDVLDLERRRPYANYIRQAVQQQQQQQLIISHTRHCVHVRGWSRSSSSSGWAAQEARIIPAERQELILGNEPLRRHTVAARVYYISSGPCSALPFTLPATCTRPSLRRSAGGKLWTLSNQVNILFLIYPRRSLLAVPRIYPGRGEDETCARWDRSPSSHHDGPFEAASISLLVALRYYHVPVHKLQKLHREAFSGLHPCLTHRRNNCIPPRSIELIHNEGLGIYTNTSSSRSGIGKVASQSGGERV
uniref:Uncharacterized protein n=1 Tax=Trichogramma kaykai TaxID=54128 RepID=A0ABD2WIA6_9HYME